MSGTNKTERRGTPGRGMKGTGEIARTRTKRRRTETIKRDDPTTIATEGIVINGRTRGTAAIW